MSLPSRFIPYLAREALEAYDTHGALPRDLLKTYAAFANTQGGLIVIGASLTPNGELLPSGLDDPRATIRRLWAMLNDPARVSANVLVNADVRLEKISGRDILAVHVPRARSEVRPVHLGRRSLGGSYRRVGSETLPCPEEVVRAMERDASPVPDARPLGNTPLSAMALATIGAYHDELQRVRPGHPWLALATPEEFLARLGAVGRSPQTRLLHPTLAGLLMFGKEETIVRELPFYGLSLQESPAEAGSELASDDGTWSGNVFDFWLRVSERLARCARSWESNVPLQPLAAEPGMQGQGPDASECSMSRPDALAQIACEAVANALAHADYRGRGGVHVRCGGDGLCVENAGLPGDDPAALLAGGRAHPRNPTLKGMFELVGVGRLAGGGFAAMRRACRPRKSAGRRTPAARVSLSEEFSPDRTVLLVEPCLGTDAVTPCEERACQSPLLERDAA